MRRAFYIPIALLGFASLVVSPTDAAAQQAGKPPLSAQQRREAKRLFDQGMLAYRRGDYEEAILRWQESYEISSHPLTFEAIANAYEKLDNYEAALEYLRKWREKAPRREHEVLDARIANYERELQKQKAQAERDAAERKRLEDTRLNAQPQPTNPDEPSTVNVMQIAGFSLVGGGAAAIITGVILDGVAAGQRPDANAVCRETTDQLLCNAADKDAINSSNTLAIAGDALWIGGTVLAAGGAALLIIDSLTAQPDEPADGKPPGAAGPSARLVPLVSPQLLGANLRVTF